MILQVSGRLQAAGAGNQVPPVQYPKWTPFWADPNNIGSFMSANVSNGYYSRTIYKNGYGGIGPNDIIEKKAPYLTEADFINYLKTIHPTATISSTDGAANGTYALDYVASSTSNGSGYGGYEGYAFYEKKVYFTGTNPVGNWEVTIQMYIYYRLVNPT